MGCLRFLGKVLAFLLLIVFIIVFPITVWTFNIQQAMLERSTYQQLIEKRVLYTRVLPALLPELIHDVKNHPDVPPEAEYASQLFANLTAACHRLGIPVIGEYFPTDSAKLTPEQMHEQVRLGSRIAAELGADAIKTFFTREFAAVTGSCPVPVFGLGAEKLPSQRDALELAARQVADGARGVVFGRNAIQVSRPFEFQAALCDVVKHGKQVDEALREYQLE